MSKYKVHQSFFSNYAISKKNNFLAQSSSWTNAYQQRNAQAAQKPVNTVKPQTTEEWMKDNVFLKVIETRQAELEQQRIQAKLKVGEPGDQYEQEADAMASKVMSMSEPAVQRDSNITPLVQMAVMSERDRRSLPENDLESRLNRSKGGGNPLPNQVKSFMEPRFGADLSRVRVHTDSSAVQMSRELGAQAFTHGSDIYYGEGKEPGNDELTAHELTHIIQQTGQVQRQLDVADVSGEAETRFRIPDSGWQHQTDQRTRIIQVEDSTLQELVDRIRNPEDQARSHIQETLDWFQQETGSTHMDREDIDLSLVLAIAVRESGVSRILEHRARGTSPIVSAGRDSYEGGSSGLDNLYRHREEFPRAIRPHIRPVRGTELEANITESGRRRGVDPAELLPRYLLAAFIVQLRSSEQRFRRVFAQVFNEVNSRRGRDRSFNESERQQLLDRLSRDARRAWIQAAFGSGLRRLLTNAHINLCRGVREAGDDISSVFNNDSFNLNSIINNDAVMGASLSGHRTRVSAAEAAILDQVLPAIGASSDSSAAESTESASPE